MPQVAIPQFCAMNTDIFTEYDDSIAAEILRDPLGLQVIWSDLGQRIFQYRLTSISPDIRNFTINLVHHYVLRALLQHGGLSLSDKQKARFPTDRSLKMGLVLFLENLLVYSLFDSDQRGTGNVSLEGLLGSLNARTRWSAAEGDPLVSSSREQELLVRQISLGINGRYKTPFVQMGLIDQEYGYHGNQELWRQVESLFAGRDAWSRGVRQLSLALEAVVGHACRAGASRPEIELPYRGCHAVAARKGVDLRALYRELFGQTRRIPVRVKRFLMEQMGLHRGAAGALYAVLSENPSLVKDREYEAAFQAASRQASDPEQKRLIDDVILVEPHLSRLSGVFDRICRPETHTVKDVRAPVEQLLRISRGRRPEIQEMRSRIAGDDSTSSIRLRKVADILLCPHAAAFLAEVQEYHQEQVMERRNLPAWFSLRGDKIIHGIRTSTADGDAFDLQHPRWIHDYYLNTVSSLQRGIGAP